jgi:DnaJ-class molecular chaperone
MEDPNIEGSKKCERCDGTGREIRHGKNGSYSYKPCPDCRGFGRIFDKRTESKPVPESHDVDISGYNIEGLVVLDKENKGEINP